MDWFSTEQLINTCKGVFFLLVLSALISCNKQSKRILDNPKANTPIHFTADHNWLKSAINTARKGNKIVIVDRGINLDDRSIKLDDITLSFKKGGLITNGTLVGKNTIHKSGIIQCYKDVFIKGSWNVEKGYLEWFIGENTKDSISNFNALTQLIEMGVEVELLKIYPIGLVNPSAFYQTSKDILIRGHDRKRTGLLLTTPTENAYFSYFRSEYGNNIKLSNLTIQTIDYKNGRRSPKVHEYQLTGGYYSPHFNPASKPNIEFVEIQNCNIYGNISIAAYSSSADNQSIADFQNRNKVKSFKIENCSFDYCNSVASFCNIGYDQVILRKNIVNNFSGSFIAFPASALPDSYYPVLNKNRAKVMCVDNVFENMAMLDIPKGGSMTPMVIKGGEGNLLFKGNKVLNLMSQSTDGQSYPFYYTCLRDGKAEVYNNIFKNIVSKGSKKRPATLIKQRGANNLIIKNNFYEITKQALVDIGVIKTVNQSLSTLSADDLYIDFMQVGSATTLCRNYLIKENTFKIPLINKSSEIWDVANFEFENNTLQIEHFGLSNHGVSVSRDGVFFYMRQRLDKIPNFPAGNFISKGNKIFIQTSSFDLIRYIDAPNGVQNGLSSSPDTNYNYKSVIFADEIHIDSTAIGYALLDTEQQSINAIMKGQKSAFELFDYANINHQRSNVKNFTSNIMIEEQKHYETVFPFTITPRATQVLNVKKNQSSRINLVDYGSALLLYNLKKDLPIAVTIKIEFIEQKGKEGIENYEFIFGHLYRSMYCVKGGGGIIGFSSNTEKGKKVLIESVSGESPVSLVLERGFQMESMAKLFFEHAENLKSFKITFESKKVPLEKSADDYKAVLREKYSKQSAKRF